ncbi:MAG TPA: HAD family phosphatase [Candidatus Dormibacteraeota bacterium]
MTLQAVLFDLDGVLVDSEPIWEQIRRDFSTQRGGTWSGEVQRQMMGARTADWATKLSENVGGKISPDEAAKAVIDELAATYRRRPPLIPGAAGAVRALAGEFKLGLVSGSPPLLIALSLELLGVTECFEVTMSADDVARGKPAPDPYLELARRMGRPPTACVVVEDSGNGIRSGHAAGMRVIAIPRGEHQPDAETLSLAAAVLGDIGDLAPYLRSKISFA